MQRIIGTVLIVLAFLTCRKEPTIDKTPITKIVAPIPEDQKDSIANRESFCRDEKEKMILGITAAYRRYQREKVPKSMKLLVELARDLRSLMRQRPQYRPCKGDIDIYNPKWKAIDVHLGYGEDFVYTGNLLYRAHQRNPHSPLRKHTLFSTIMGVTESHQLGLMPNIKAALRYVKEFPKGPFIEEAHWVIAEFFKDLFMVLRDELQDFKYDCFKRYIDTSSLPKQAKRAQAKAIASYQMILKLNPENADAAKLLGEVQRGTIKAWSFCAD